MKTGVVTFEVDPTQIDEATSLWEELIAEMRQFKGFKASYLLANSTSGKCLGEGIWETLKDSEIFGASSTYRDFTVRLNQLVRKTPMREQFDLRTGLSEEIDLLSDLRNPSHQVAS